MRIVAVLSFDEVNALLVALQDRIRNDSGLITERGIRYYRGLHDRLEALWRAEDEPLHLAANDASWRSLSGS